MNAEFLINETTTISTNVMAEYFISGPNKSQQMASTSSMMKYILTSPNRLHFNDNNFKVVELDFESPVFQSEDIELECFYRLNPDEKLYSIKW